MSIWFRNIAVGVIIVVLLLAVLSLFPNPERRVAVQEISFSEFLTHVDQGRVRDVLIQGSEIHGTYKDGRNFQTYAPNESSLITRLHGQGVGIAARFAMFLRECLSRCILRAAIVSNSSVVSPSAGKQAIPTLIDT